MAGVDPRLSSREPFSSSPAIRVRMQNQRMRDTKPEMELRRRLHKMGLRYRVDRKIVTGTHRRVDIVFPAPRVAVFVDGCFWHGCLEHGAHVPSVNQWYWPDKIERNRNRDRDTDMRLRNDGWLVVRVWEHDDPRDAAARVARAVRRRQKH